MRPHAPWGSELRSRCDENEQWRERSTFGNAAQYVERRRIGPMQVFYRKDHGLNPGTGDDPVGQRR
jgi:hypothetical protein